MTSAVGQNPVHFDLSWQIVGPQGSETYTNVLTWSPPHNIDTMLDAKAQTVADALNKKFKEEILFDTQKIVNEAQAALKKGISPLQLESYRPFLAPEIGKEVGFTFIGDKVDDPQNFLRTLNNSRAVYKKEPLDKLLNTVKLEDCKKTFENLTPMQKKIYEVMLAKLVKKIAGNLPVMTPIIAWGVARKDSASLHENDLNRGVFATDLVKLPLLKFYALKLALSYKQ